MNIYDKSDFVDIKEVIADIKTDVRYYSDYNFVGCRVDGYNASKIYMTKEAAKSLKKVSDELSSMGYGLLIYDAYRPLKAVKHFVRWAKDIDDTKMKEIFYPNVDKRDLFRLGYIAEYSSHCKGSTVDLTITKEGKELDMGGYFDYFGGSSASDYKNLSNEQLINRKLLKDVMFKYGFTGIDSEWWHFTLRDEPYPDTYFDFDIE